MHDTEFYRQLLGLADPWQVTAVRLDLAANEVVIEVAYGGTRGVCPECDATGPLHDHAPERRWRHLDTCQVRTYLVCRVPRVCCPAHQVRTMAVPWAAPHGRFTLMFEWLVLQWLKLTRCQTAVAARLGLSQDQVQQLMHLAVRRGLAAREEYPIPMVGLDEKSMKKGHHYLTVLSDLEWGQVYDVAEGRTQASAEAVLGQLSDLQRQTIQCACMDMWEPYQQAVRAKLPQAAIVHDRYHVSAHLNQAVDQTRRAEQRRLAAAGERRLKRSRYLFLYNYADLTAAQATRFETAYAVATKTAGAWTSKETFRAFWDQPTVAAGRRFLERWVQQATSRGLPALTRVATMLARHASGLVNYLTHRVTNALAENLNGQIQLIKATARGFRGFQNYRTTILFHLGGLDLNPLNFR